MITVVCGLAVDAQGRMLMALRRASDRRPNVWELPGGKVEPGENERRALEREWKEELGVWISVRDVISTVSLTFERRAHIILFGVEIEHGDPQPLASQRISWFEPAFAIQNLPIVPSHAAFHGDIITHFAERGL